ALRFQSTTLPRGCQQVTLLIHLQQARVTLARSARPGSLRPLQRGRFRSASPQGQPIGSRLASPSRVRDKEGPTITSADLLADTFERIHEIVAEVLDGLRPEDLTARLDDEA